MRLILVCSIVFAATVCSPRAAAERDLADEIVAQAARDALRTGDFTPIVIWVQKPQEQALHAAFRQTQAVRVLNREARELADEYFVDVAVRLHREAERDLFDGPARRAATRALAEHDGEIVVDVIVDRMRANLRARLRDVAQRRDFARGDVAGGRAYVASYTAFLRYAAALYAAATAPLPRIEEPERHER
jgi:hypothetical protein